MLFRSRLVGEHIAIRTAYATGLGKVFMDPGSLEQVIVNLTVNARDAMPAGGHITIEARNLDGQPVARRGHRAGRIRITVSDTGSGMEAAVAARIFEPFFTTKDVGKGTGLGLSLSFSIIKRHEGRIEVRSTPGVGSAFRVWVPVAGPQAASGQPAEIGRAHV